jgi:hypothetical protein
MENESNRLRADVERNEDRSHLAGLILIAGLLIAVLLAVVFPAGKTPVENWGPVVADVMVALGVYGEIYFSGKASRSQKALQAIIDARLTEALERATKAERELLAFRRPRRALMTAENRAKLDVRLRPFRQTKYDVGVGGSDGEQADFLWDLEEVLVAAGWQQCPWVVNLVGAVNVVHRNLRPVAGLVGAQNVEIHLHPSFRQALQPAAEALIAALKAINIDATEIPMNAHSSTDDAMHILIGPKR